jgi:hypothetical protein
MHQPPQMLRLCAACGRFMPNARARTVDRCCAARRSPLRSRRALRQAIPPLLEDFCPPPDSCAHSLLLRLIDRHQGHHLDRCFRHHVAVSHQRDVELPILLPARRGFCHEEVEHVQAIPDAPVGCAALDPLQPVFPAFRQARRPGVDLARSSRRCRGTVSPRQERRRSGRPFPPRASGTCPPPWTS